MGFDLTNEEQRDQTADRESVSGGSPDYIKFTEPHNYVVLHYEISKKTKKVSVPYEEQFVHWVRTGSNEVSVVKCMGGVARGGFAPDICAFCKESLKHYQRRKELEKSGDAENEAIEKKLGDEMRAKHTIVMNAFRVEGERFKDKKTKESYVEVTVPENPQWQKLVLSKFQFAQLREIIKEELGGDGQKLKNKVLDFFREKKKGQKVNKFSKILVAIVGKISKFPKFTNKPFDLEDEFKDLDEDEADTLLQSYLNFVDAGSDDDDDYETASDDDDDDDDDE